MNDLDWHSVLASNARGSGKTTAMAEAAKKINGVLIVRNWDEVRRVQSELRVDARSVHFAMKMRGDDRPILFDPNAVAVLCYEKDCERRLSEARLQERIKELERQIASAPVRRRKKPAAPTKGGRK